MGFVQTKIPIGAAGGADPPFCSEVSALFAFVIPKGEALGKLGLVAFAKNLVVMACGEKFRKGVGDAVVAVGSFAGLVMGFVVPGGVDDADSSEVQGEGEGLEPFGVGHLLLGIGKGVQGLLVLFLIGFRSFAEVIAVTVGILPSDGVDLVVSEDHEGGAVIDHAADDGECRADFFALIDNVSDEDGLAGGVGVGAVFLFIA
ncbi:MAG: hypothetical protein EBT07_10305 [Actinobacteria bacterium]|nr:hypothetical protein [Actinomycetota bacterium]